MQSWVEQTAFSGRFQLLLVDVGKTEGIIPELRSMLRPQEIVPMGDGEKIESYLAGLKHARGSVIILTEGHVAAEPTCIEAVFGHFEANPESAGWFFRWLHDNQTEVARMEEAF